MKGQVDIEDYREMAEETGKLPRVLKEMPVLQDDYYHYFNSWNTLRCFARPGEKISLADIKAYLSINSSFDPNEFLLIMLEMDKAAGF